MVASGNGWASGTSFSDRTYSGDGAYSGSTSDSTSWSAWHGSLAEEGGEGYTNQYRESWTFGSGGVTGMATSTTNSYRRGGYGYHYDWSAAGTWTEGNSSSGSVNYSEGDYSRDLSESFRWDATQIDYKAYSGSATSLWSQSSGSGTGSGVGELYNHNYFSGSSWAVSAGNAAYHSWTSGLSHDATDYYGYSAGMSSSSGSDGATAYDSWIDNHVHGTSLTWGAWTDWWSQTWSDGSGSGGGSTSSTSGSVNGPP
ncbi:MAG: hypothetical protein V1790_08270, partial [Planctomycetota bacterium]